MSFSKAKLIRFNDVPKDSPSPANNYKTIKSTEKTKKAAHSPTISENGSVKSVPANFKTPTLPKQTKTASSAIKLKPKELFSIDFEALREKTEECERKTKFIHKLSEELETCNKNLEHLRMQKEQMEREHQNELQNLEFEILQTMNRLQNQEENAKIKLNEIEKKLQKEIEILQKSHEYHIGQVILDYEIKLKEYKESSEEILKQKLKEIENIWREKLENNEKEHEAILKECQEISEYNIIQCELEKKEIQQSLEQTNILYKNLEKKYQEKLSEEKFNIDCEKELNKKIEFLNEVLLKTNEEVRKLKGEVKAYQMTINNSQTAIEVMKKRLIESDRGVEQLKLELTKCEEKLLDYEGKYYHVTTELNEARQLNEELEIQFEAALESNVESIKLINQALLDKVNKYQEQVHKYSKQIKEQQELKNDIIIQLNRNIEMVQQVSLELEKSEEYYSVNIKDLKDELQKRENLNEEKDQKIKELEEKIENLLKTNEDLNGKCDYYKSKADEFELETKDSTETRKKYIEISGKYDALLQDFEHLNIENRDDKIKISGLHKKLAQLLKIEENYEKMKKEKDILESENLTLKNKFEEQKLKKKYKFGGKDKENAVASPNRSIMESPNRGSPFRERN